MNKDYGITTFIMDSGERYCLIIDRLSKLPLYYPNLFLTTQLRNSKSSSLSSITSAANHLVVFFRFLKYKKIDIETRIRNREYFEIHELDDLRDFTQRQFSIKNTYNVIRNRLNLENPKNNENIVESSTQYMRLTTIANYLSWFANHIISHPSFNESNQINRLEVQIKSRRPSRKGRNNIKDRSLDDIQLIALFEVIKVRSEFNPFDLEVQTRNRLMILVLCYLGLRGGELLNLKIEDIDFSKKLIKVVRRADEMSDPRIKEPNVKTLERVLPIAENLCKELHDYIVKDRRNIPNAKKNSFLFVTHKLGPTVGKPISRSGYNKVISVIKTISPQLYTLTGHMLRHTWNRKFSEQMDLMDNSLSEEKQEQVRSYLMGWKSGSGSAIHYNKRFVQEQAHKAALRLQINKGMQLPKEFGNDK